MRKRKSSRIKEMASVMRKEKLLRGTIQLPCSLEGKVDILAEFVVPGEGGLSLEEGVTYASKGARRRERREA